MVLLWGGKQIFFTIGLTFERLGQEVHEMRFLLLQMLATLSSHLCYSACPQECFLLSQGVFLCRSASANGGMLQAILPWIRAARENCRTARSAGRPAVGSNQIVLYSTTTPEGSQM